MQRMTTIFTKIINREIPAQFIYEDDICIAIMDKFPSVPGQSMIILKREVDYIFNLTTEEYEHLFLIAKKIAQATDQALAVERTCLVVEGFEVPHVHIKLYPIKEVGDATSLTSIAGQRSEKTDAELSLIAQDIISAL